MSGDPTAQSPGDGSPQSPGDGSPQSHGDGSPQSHGDGSPQSPGELSDSVELREDMQLYVERATEKLMELMSLTEAAAHGVQSLSEQCSQNARFLRAWVLFIRSGGGFQGPPLPNPIGLVEEEEEDGAAE